MNSELEALLNHIGAGTFIVIASGIACMVFTLYKIYQGIASKIRKKTEHDIADATHMAGITQSVNELVKQINELQHSVNSMGIDQQSFTSQLTDFEKKLDDVRDASSKQDASFGTQITDIQQIVKSIDNSQALIIEADKDSILTYITDIYYDAIQNKYIPMHTLSNAEKQYKNYLKFNGDAFAEAMMKELRVLPKTNPNKPDEFEE